MTRWKRVVPVPLRQAAAAFVTLCLCLGTSASILNRHGYFTDAALAGADVEGLDDEIALAGCDKAFEDAASLAATLSGHDRLAVECRLEMARGLANYVAARANAPARDDLILAWQGAKELESFFDYFHLERKRHEGNARLPAPKVFDVRDFGARGDGTGDDGPAFVAAIEAARECGGAPAVVFAPEGTYRIAPDPRYPVKDFTCRDMSTGESRGTARPYSGEKIHAVANGTTGKALAVKRNETRRARSAPPPPTADRLRHCDKKKSRRAAIIRPARHFSATNSGLESAGFQAYPPILGDKPNVRLHSTKGAIPLLSL